MTVTFTRLVKDKKKLKNKNLNLTRFAQTFLFDRELKITYENFLK